MDCVNTEYQIKHSTTQTLHACRPRAVVIAGPTFPFHLRRVSPCCFADSGERFFTRNSNLQRIRTPWRILFLSRPSILRFCSRYLCSSFRIINTRGTTNLNTTKQWYTSYYAHCMWPCNILQWFFIIHLKKRTIYICLTKTCFDLSSLTSLPTFLLNILHPRLFCLSFTQIISVLRRKRIMKIFINILLWLFFLTILIPILHEDALGQACKRVRLSNTYKHSQQSIYLITNIYP